MNKFAVLDLGTNVFNLLIAENSSEGLRFIEVVKEPSMIGAAGLADGNIKPVAFERAASALKKLRNRIDEYSMAEGTRLPVFAFATSAFRDATNGKELAEHLKAETDITVNIIGGDDEARFVFEGVRLSNPLVFKDLSVNKLIMDIGGGSVEFIITDGENILWEMSFPLGVARLREKFEYTDPIPDNILADVSTYIMLELRPLWDAIEEYSPRILVGSSGSFDTFRDMINLDKFSCAINEKEGRDATEDEIDTFRSKLRKRTSANISFSDFEALYSKLLKSTSAERMLMPGMSKVRERFIVLGAVISKIVIKKSAVEEIWQSTYSLREGAATVLYKSAE